ncbi:hypothetical protein DVH05_000138 [Phytophthora capsici]|nr:hypothetical protein DVH05_000138 [Phytophthora capsici]
MMQWLETRREVSEITRPMLRSFIHSLNAKLVDMGAAMDSHVEEFIAMKADSSVNADRIEKHRLEGFIAEIRYHRMSRLSIATGIVDMLVVYLENKLPRWLCKCDSCAYYRSDQWFKDQPCDLAIRGGREHGIKCRI